MKPSHLTTPRTLSDATFVTGYQSARIPPLHRVLGVLLAVLIGVTLALLAVRELAGG